MTRSGLSVPVRFLLGQDAREHDVYGELCTDRGRPVAVVVTLCWRPNQKQTPIQSFQGLEYAVTKVRPNMLEVTYRRAKKQRDFLVPDPCARAPGLA